MNLVGLITVGENKTFFQSIYMVQTDIKLYNGFAPTFPWLLMEGRVEEDEDLWILEYWAPSPKSILAV